MPLKCETVPEIYLDEDGLLHIERGTFEGPGTIDQVSRALLARINLILEVKAASICADLEIEE